MEHGQQHNPGEDERILQQPVAAVQRVDCQHCPPDAKKHGEDQQIVAMAD
jgi:hypothetical protein